MSKVPINRAIEDLAYRYQMPLLQTKIEGKGINVRTVLPNLKEVAEALRVPISYILKFMSYELGSNVISREQNNSSVSQINGQLNENDVLNTLDKFIDKFILCEKCKYPETFMQVDASKGLVGVCNACGHVTVIDPKHKLTGFIKKNPPENMTEIKKREVGESSKVEKKERKMEAKKYTARRLVKESKDELDPYDEENKEAYESVNEYLNDIVPMGEDYLFDDNDVENVYKAVKRLRLNREKYDKVGLMLFNYIFNEKTIFNVKGRAVLLEQVLERHRMEEFVGHELVYNLAYFFYVRFPAKDWTKAIPTILKAFHDEDIVSDEFLIEWSEDKFVEFSANHHLYNKENNDKLKSAAQVFIDWLKPDSEEEGDEDEEEEEDD